MSCAQTRHTEGAAFRGRSLVSERAVRARPSRNELITSAMNCLEMDWAGRIRLINADLAELLAIAHREDKSIQESLKATEANQDFAMAHNQLAQA